MAIIIPLVAADGSTNTVTIDDPIVSMTYDILIQMLFSLGDEKINLKKEKKK